MPISRRDFVKGTLAIAAASLGALAFRKPDSESFGAAQGLGRQEFQHRGRRVVIEETETGVSVTIDGLHQHHIAKKVPPQGPPFFVSHMLPFENFAAAAPLVRQLIDLEADMELFDLG